MPSPRRIRLSDLPFFAVLISLAGMYLLLVVAMLAADIFYAATDVTREQFTDLLGDEDVRFAVWLTLISCTVSAILSVIVAVPAGYLLSRYRFPGKALIDAILDIPIVLPPLVVGLSLLILFNQMPPEFVRDWFLEKFDWDMGTFEQMIRRIFGERAGVTFNWPAVILAQFSVACAFAVRTMRNTFDQISPRTEQVALTLGCGRMRAFLSVVVPEAWRGISTAGTLAWTRSMGEFGPILVFASTISGKTEVLSSRVFLEISIGNLEGAVIVSLLMVTIAVIVLVAVRAWDKGSQSRYVL